jgi:cold shock CspA family protein
LDVYFTHKVVDGSREVLAGDRVEYDATDAERGPRATRVVLL